MAGILLLGNACKKTVTNVAPTTMPAPSPAVFFAADRSRADLLLSVTVPSLARTSAKIDALAKKLGLPFSGQDLPGTLAAKWKLPAEVTTLVDVTRPIGMVFVGRGKGAEPHAAFAIPSRNGDTAKKLIAALGTVEENQKGAQKIKRPDDSRFWVVLEKDTLVIAESPEALAAGGALAIEAQHTHPDDLVVALFPDALARIEGTDVKTALAKFRKRMMDQQAAGAEQVGLPAPTPAERAAMETSMDLLLAPVADTASAELSFVIDAERGLKLATRLRPRAGSALARQIAPPAPYVVDPNVLRSSDSAAAVWASGPSETMLDLQNAILTAQAKAGLKGAGELSTAYRALRPMVSGAIVAVLRTNGNTFAYDVVLPLRTGVSPKAALDTLAALLDARVLGDYLGGLYGALAPKIRQKRKGETVRMDLVFPAGRHPLGSGTLVKALFGSSTITALAAVADDRLLISIDPAAEKRLNALIAPTSGAPAAELATAVADTNGQDGFGYLDLMAVVRPMLAMARSDPQAAQMLAMASALPGFTELKIPLVMSYRGGEQLTAELRIPVTTISGVAGVLRPFLGMGLGGNVVAPGP